jgi:WD40 repeat protein
LDKTARVWDLASGQCTATLEGHSKSVQSVAFSPDGRLLATASDDKTARVWDLASGQCTATLEGHPESVSSVANVD